VPRPLRFCLVTTFYPPYHFGGDAVFVQRLAAALAGEGHAVDVIHSVDAYRLQRPGEPPVAFPETPGVTRHPIETASPFWSSLAAHQLGRPAAYGRALRDVLDTDRYDVIHFHNVSLLGGPGVLELGRAVKLYTAHEYWLVCPTHVLFAFDREACTERRCLACTLSYRRPPQLWRFTGRLHDALRHVSALLLPSVFALERHREQGIDRPMYVLPHFVPAPAAEHTDAGPPPTPGGRPYFLYVGRLEKLKGVEDLVALFATYDAADLVLVGEGSYGEELRRRAAGLRHVHFLGARHPGSLGALYRGAVAVMAPSRCFETFGLTAVESLAHGTPVIVRRIGALTEIVEQSGGGFTFTDPGDCRDAMERLRTDAALRESLGRKGQAAADERWSREAHLARYLGIVDEALAGRAAHAVDR
jgi:glycosyltransferase involved in cell wall biosynthesis